MNLSSAGLRRRYYRCYAGGWLVGLTAFGLGGALLGAIMVHREAAEEHGAFSAPVASVMALLLGGSGIAIVTWAIRGAERRIRLVRDGAAVLGWITEVKVLRIQRSWLDAFLFTPFGSRPIRTYYQPRYAFCDVTGCKHVGAGLVSRIRRWQDGDPVLVVYDRSHPEHYDVDWFGLRAAELHALLCRA